MKGSKSVNERLDILNIVDKIIFVSDWSRERFFNDIDKKLLTKTEIIYPSVNRETKKMFVRLIELKKLFFFLIIKIKFKRFLICL